MKKLMTMLGAVAMSFGLFATDVVTSFEAGEPGVEGTSFTKTTGWNWTGDEPLVLGTDGASRDLPYTDEGPMARRTFASEDNDNYLKLSTGSDEVSRTADGGAVLDQLVKFTGFDTEPTVEEGKVAVWMSEFENEDASTETNLYVTVGKVTAGDEGAENVEPVSIKIKGDFALDTWYRLTIKNVGDIYAGAAGTTARAGFNVYVNGNQIEAEDKAACGALIYNKDDMPKHLQADLEAGKLFPAIDATDVLFNSVAFKGIGEVDDIYIDAEGPVFCQGVNLADVTVPDFAELVKVVDSKGAEFTDFPATVAPGALTITLKAADGYILKGSGIYNANTADLEDGVLDVTDLIQKGDFVASIATISWNDSIDTTNVASLVEGLAIVQELEKAGEKSIEIEICADGAAVEDIQGYGKLGFGASAYITITPPDDWSVSGDMTFAGTVAGKLTVDGTLAIAEGGEIKLTGVGTIITETNDLDITTDDVGKKVVYEEGAYVIVDDLAKITVTLVNDPEVATVTGLVDGQKVTENDEVKFTVVLKEGFKDLKVEGATKTENDNEYAFTAGKDDVTITITADALAIWTVTIGAYDTTNVTLFSANPTEVREDAESKTVTLSASFGDGYELDYYTVDGAPISGNTFEITKSVTVGVVAKATAAPTPSGLPDSEKEAYDNWAKNPEKACPDGDDPLVADQDMIDAYLLDCAAGENALADAKAAFKITSIAFENGEWVVKTVDKATGAEYGNGVIKMLRFSDVGCTTPANDGNFFKTKLVFKTEN